MNSFSQSTAPNQPRPEAVSAPDTSRSGCGFLFCLVFLLFGLGFMTPFAMATWRSVRALTWQQVPCVIDQSRLESHSGDDGNTYSVELAYHYRFEGREYSGDRYKFLDMSTSGRRLKQRVLRRYPVGGDAECWVDPAAPSRSVIRRGLTLDYLFALIPGIFVLIGGAGIMASLNLLPARFANHKQLAWRVDDSGKQLGRAHYETPLQETGPKRFESSRGVAALAGQVVALLLFGGALVVLFRIDESVMWLFRIGFGFATLIIASAVVHSLLALRNPRVVLVVDETRLNPGDEIRLQVEIEGQANVFDRFVLALEGVEEARYTRGTDTVTDTHVFHRQTIAELPAGVRPGGSYSVSLPEDAMHSFASRNNKIRWLLAVDGEIERWPDVKDRHEIEILPIASAGQPARGSASAVPGGRVEMDVDWQFSAQPERVEIRLVWYTSGKGDRDVSVVEVQTIEPALACSSRRVSFAVPEGPCSYTGRLLSITWAIDVVALPSGESCRFDFEVAPATQLEYGA